MGKKEISLEKTIFELCGEDSKIIDILAEAGFTDILKPGMIQTAGRFMTIAKGAAFKKIDMEDIKHKFALHGYTFKRNGGKGNE